MSNSECTCNYSWICFPCQEKIKVRVQEEYTVEVQKWTFEAIKAIAEHLNVNLPPPPIKPNY